MPGENGAGGADQVLREEDVDEEMFIFPDRAKADGAEEEKVLETPQLQEALKSTAELI